MITSLILSMALLAPAGQGIDGLSLSEVDRPAICNATRVSLSPDGRWLASWTRSGDMPLNTLSPVGGHGVISVASVDCLVKTKRDCPGRIVKVRNGIKALAWTTDEGLAFVTGGDALVLTSPGGQAIRSNIILPRGRLTGRFQMSGPLDRAALQRWTNAPQGGSGAVEAVYSVRGAFRETRFDRETLDQTFLEDGRPLTLSAPLPPDTIHWREAPRYYGGRWTFVATGGLLPRAEAEASLINPQPLIDAADGSVAGAFDDRQITWSGPPAGLESPDLDYLSDASFNSRTGLLAYTLKFLDGRHAVILARDGRTVFRGDCENQSNWQRDTWRPAISARYVDWGVPGRRLPVRLAQQDSPLGLIIVWNGGPGETVTRGQSQFMEQDWLQRGFDVATVEGSGSIGEDFLDRLRREGFDANRMDGQAAVDGLQRLPVRYDRYIVAGASFGAVAATEMATRLQRDWPGAKVGLVLVAPWLVYRDPDQRQFADDLGRINPDFARRADRELFGPPHTASGTGYGDRMAAWRKGARYDGPLLVVFGGRDGISRPEDLWPTGKSGRVVVLPTAGHATVLSLAAPTINSWIADTAQ